MKQVFYSICILLFINSCSPSMKTTSTWVNKDKSVFQNKNYKTIFVAVITSDLEVRTKLEAELEICAKKHGYAVIKSIDKFNPGKLPSKEEALDIIRKSGAELIFSTALVDEKSESRYVQGTNFSPIIIGGYRGYYIGASAYYQPGYYTTDKTYFLESNLFDVASETLIWSAQSQVFNPSSIQSSSRRYTDLMLENLEKDGILKPVKK